MVIGVISDTHRDYFYIYKALEKFKNTDLLIHLGDNVRDVEYIKGKYNKKIISVRGNCDFSKEVPSEKIIEIEGEKIFITHGHKFNVKSGISMIKEKSKKEGCKIALYGHTHISKIDYEDGIWFVNPGSPSMPRDGFNSVSTIEINKGKITPKIVAL